jgi:hypothetical protein
MNKITKAMAAAAVAALIGYGGWVTTSANAATNDEIATYLTNAVAEQLGIPADDSLRRLILDAMANNLIDPTVTDAAGLSVDGLSTLNPEELAALLNSNLTQQLGAIEQALLDLGVTTEPEVPGVTPEEDDDLYESDDVYEEDVDVYEEDVDTYEEDEETSDDEDLYEEELDEDEIEEDELNDEEEVDELEEEEYED